MAISLDGLVVLNLVFLVIVISLTVSRQWILRNRPKTAAQVISDVSLILFSAVIIVIGAFELKNTFDEKKLRKKYSDEKDVVERLVTGQYLRISFGCLVLYTTQLWFLKAAYLGYFVLLRRHFSQKQILLLNATILYCVLSFIVAMTVQLTLCLPIERNWSLGQDACVGLSTVVGSTIQAWLNLTGDLLILLLAVVAVSALQLGRQERYALIFVVVLGSVSPVMCLVRFVHVYNAARHPGDAGLDVLRNIYLWGKFEVCFGHIAFCLPALRVLWRRTAERSSKAKYMLSSLTSGSKERRKRPIQLDEISEGSGSQEELRTGNKYNNDDNIA